MQQTTVIFGAVCLFAIVSISITGCSAEFDAGGMVKNTGEAIQTCTDSLNQKQIRSRKAPYFMAACLLKQAGVMDKHNKLNFKRLEKVSILKQMRSPLYKVEVEILKKCAREVMDYSDECQVTKELFKCTILGAMKKLLTALD